MGILAKTAEYLREANRKVQELNENPSRPDYQRRVKDIHKEYADKVAKLCNEYREYVKQSEGD